MLISGVIFIRYKEVQKLRRRAGSISKITRSTHLHRSPVTGHFTRLPGRVPVEPTEEQWLAPYIMSTQIYSDNMAISYQSTIEFVAVVVPVIGIGKNY